MSRELTKSEMAIAAELCWQIREHDPSGTTDITGCPTCRADVVRLVDAPPSERVTEVTEEDVAWITALWERAKHDETQEWVVDENPMLERQMYERIKAAVEYCAALNRRPDA